ncbi:dienelactone hydrolase family protein [Planotetraspora kaengkrachanensis]|uniref:Carboxymethylenebutenolidase n=1 Tax=Planotetraspora kaengkrachanensis TaxID=575193 RepID=A0A8J3LZD3_9ACTN|nr:dienelactone hydrolase family protein [Planotetraspora kaengkrachanensis]GIG80744.1 carboxymethylenebutenolidase [Planotetraspora kaengkrachanensis]
MCYEADAVPPVPASSAVVLSSGRVTLPSADGTEVAAFHAVPGGPSGVGVLVLPDNRGLSGFYEQLSLRLAEHGHPAVAIDYFSRTSRLEDREPEFPFMDHLGKLTRDVLYDDFTAGVTWLRSRGCAAVVSLGFCLGGRFAFTTALERFGLAGVVGLYGYPDELFGAAGPTQLASGFTAPVLGMFGGGDEGIPPAVVDAFGHALESAGVPHDFVTYPGAPHGFFEMGNEEFAGASADAWRRILAFLDERS